MLDTSIFTFFFFQTVFKQPFPLGHYNSENSGLFGKGLKTLCTLAEIILYYVFPKSPAASLFTEAVITQKPGVGWKYTEKYAITDI